jgi:hypothetical protein
MFCSRCGWQNVPEARFCFKCGAPTPSMPPSPGPSARPQIMPQTVSTPQYTNPSPSAAASPLRQRSRHRALLLGVVAGVVVAFTGVAFFFVLQSDEDATTEPALGEVPAPPKVRSAVQAPAANSPPSTISPRAVSPSQSRTVDLATRVRELRSSSWAFSAVTGVATDLYSDLNVTDGNGPEHTATLDWSAPDGVTIRLSASAKWATWDSGDRGSFGDGQWPERRVQVRGTWPGSEPGGSIIVSDRQQLMPSNGEAQDFFARAYRRADGHVLVAFDTYGRDAERWDEVTDKPGVTRYVLLVWDAPTEQVLVVADWKGNWAEAPAWASRGW